MLLTSCSRYTSWPGFFPFSFSICRWWSEIPWHWQIWCNDGVINIRRVTWRIGCQGVSEPWFIATLGTKIKKRAVRVLKKWNAFSWFECIFENCVPKRNSSFSSDISKKKKSTLAFVRDENQKRNSKKLSTRIFFQSFVYPCIFIEPLQKKKKARSKFTNARVSISYEPIIHYATVYHQKIISKKKRVRVRPRGS